MPTSLTIWSELETIKGSFLINAAQLVRFDLEVVVVKDNFGNMSLIEGITRRLLLIMVKCFFFLFNGGVIIGLPQSLI